jgi:hypothetical protein
VIETFKSFDVDPESGWIRVVEKPATKADDSESEAKLELDSLEAELGEQLDAISIENRLEMCTGDSEFTRKAVARRAGRLHLLRKLKVKKNGN